MQRDQAKSVCEDFVDDDGCVVEYISPFDTYCRDLVPSAEP